MEARRDSLRRQIDSARQGSGDQVASESLGIDRDLEFLRTTYPERLQFSLFWDPDLQPLSPPFYAYGLWHDHDNTFVRVLAPDPEFRDEQSGTVLEPSELDSFLYRLQGVVENGSVTVGPSGGRLRAYWRRRVEVERP